MKPLTLTQLVVDACWLYFLDSASPSARPGLDPEPLQAYIKEISIAMMGAAAYLVKYDNKEVYPNDIPIDDGALWRFRDWQRAREVSEGAKAAKAALAAGVIKAMSLRATDRSLTPWVDFTKYAYEGDVPTNEDSWRDEYYSKYEPPGSYGLCWKPIGHDLHCSRSINHNGECGEDEEE